MRRPQGYAQWREGNDGTIQKEHDTVTCGHCSFIAMVPPGCQPGDSCKMCSRFICEQCAAIPSCRPFEMHIEALESRGQFLKAVGLDSVRSADARRVHKMFEERAAFEAGRLQVVNGKIIPGAGLIERDNEFESRIRAMRMQW